MSHVTPGERVGVEEEALPTSGVYVDKKGNIRSLYVGRAILDVYKKTISVKPFIKRDLTLKQGAVVEGRVMSTSDEIAVIRIYSHENNRVDAVGLLHISQISSEYVKDINDYVKPGDIIKAKVINSSVPYLLTTREPSLGVIYAQCSNCGSTLYLHSSGYLTCKTCGNQEKRKVAVGYLYVLR